MNRSEEVIREAFEEQQIAQAALLETLFGYQEEDARDERNAAKNN